MFLNRLMVRILIHHYGMVGNLMSTKNRFFFCGFLRIFFFFSSGPFGNSENCVQLSGGLNDLNCMEILYFVVEYGTTTVDAGIPIPIETSTFQCGGRNFYFSTVKQYYFDV